MYIKIYINLPFHSSCYYYDSHHHRSINAINLHYYRLIVVVPLSSMITITTKLILSLLPLAIYAGGATAALVSFVVVVATPLPLPLATPLVDVPLPLFSI